MNNDQYGYLNDSTLASIQQAIDSYKNLPNIAQLYQLQREINAIRVPLANAYAVVAEYQKIVAPLSETIARLNSLYEPIREMSREFQRIYNDSTIAAIKSCVVDMRSVFNIDFAEINAVAQSLSQSATFAAEVLRNIDFEETADLYQNGSITAEDVAEEVCDIVKNKKFAPLETWDKIKKSKWFLGIRVIIVIVGFLASPVGDKVKENTLEALGVNDFWEESGIYEWLDDFFNVDDAETESSDTSETAETNDKLEYTDI